MMRLTFLPFRNDLSALHILYHVYGPLLSGHPYPRGVRWLFFLYDPELYNLLSKDLGIIERVVEKRITGERLGAEERKIFRISKRFWLGSELRRFVEEKYNEFVKLWKEYESDVVGLLENTFEVPDLHVFVFPSYEADGDCGGSVHRGRYIGMNFGRAESRHCVFTFIHELIHVYHRNDVELQNKLEELRKQYKLPIHEAFTEVIKNVVSYRAGLQETPFTSYYQEGWEELKEWEDRFRSVLQQNNYEPRQLREYILTF